MLAVEISAQVKRRFGDEAGIIIVDTDIVNWLNEGMEVIARETQWNWKSATVNASAASAGAVSITGAQIELYREVIYRPDANTKKVLDLLSYDELNSGLYALTAQGTPAYYVPYPFGGDNLDPNIGSNQSKMAFYPAPLSTDTGTIQVDYVAAPTKLANINSYLDTPYQFHRDLANFCMIRCHERMQNYQAQTKAQSDFDKTLAQRRYEALNQDDEFYVIRDDPNVGLWW